MKNLHIKRIKLEFENDITSIDIDKEIKNEKERLLATEKYDLVKEGKTTITDNHIIISTETTEQKQKNIRSKWNND